MTAKNASTCAPLTALLRQLFGSCRQGAGRNGKRPESYLTPYEMEMVPLMLKELDDLDHRFYQMVCYRWFKEAAQWPGTTSTVITSVNFENESSIAEPVSRCASTCGPPVDQVQNASSYSNGNSLCVGASATCSASTTTISTTSSATITRLNNRNVEPTFEDFVNDGMVLRHLIRVLSRTLRDTGAFDDKCEAALFAYRTRRQQWQADAAVAPANVSSRVRSFSALTVAGTMTTTTTTSAATNDGYAKSKGTTPTPILLLNNEPSEAIAEPTRVIQRRRPATTIVDNRPPVVPITKIASTPGPATVIVAPTKQKPTSKRAQHKQRKRDASACDALFAQLGDILRHQFHTTVTVSDHKRALPSHQPAVGREAANENVHERELKVLIWRHFVQMLIAMLTDRDRFPA